MPATHVRLLGPLEVTLDGHPVELRATKQRAVLAILALRECWNGAYRYLAQAAPAAPLANRRGAVFVSKRLGNYQHHPLLGVLLDQVWVR